MLRFVILEHDHPVLHWDLMLEAGDLLRTWRLAEAPVGDALIAAESSFDHRLLYLDYEGPISGNRGTVKRWDHGNYAIVAEVENGLLIRFDGTRLQGIFRLHQTGQGGWTFQRPPRD